MKTALSFLFSTVLSLTTFAQKETQSKKLLHQYRGTVKLFGFVTKANYLTGLKGSPTMMNLSAKDLRQPLTLVVLRSDRPKFKEAPETAFLNEYVEVKGKIEIYKGKLQMILHDEQQIAVFRESFPRNKLGEPD